MNPEQPRVLDQAPVSQKHPLSDREETRELLVRCQQGDQAAWSRLVRLYSGLVYSIARHHDLPEDRCDDIAQLVFTSLLKHVGNIRDAVALPAWIGQTTRRACWRMIERLRREQATLRDVEQSANPLCASDAASTEVASLLSRIEQAHAVRRALDELGGRCLELLRALFVEVSTPDYDAIGRRLGMPVGSIGPTRVRCLAKLATILEAQQNPTDLPS